MGNWIISNTRINFNTFPKTLLPRIDSHWLSDVKCFTDNKGEKFLYLVIVVIHVMAYNFSRNIFPRKIIESIKRHFGWYANWKVHMVHVMIFLKKEKIRHGCPNFRNFQFYYRFTVYLSNHMWLSRGQQS